MGCEIRAGTHRYFGVVLNVSEQGLFLQTNARIEPGTLLDLTLSAANDTAQLALRGRVARRLRAPQQLASVVPSGLGVRLLDPPVAYRDFVAKLLGPARGGDFRFRVEMSEVRGTQTRTVLVSCRSEAEATELANAELDEGWKLVSVQRV
jgi:hypothetical protein